MPVHEPNRCYEKLVICWIFWAVTLTYQCASGCRQSWTPNYRTGACYKLFNNIGLDWSDAKSFCNDHNAYLTDMRDYFEQKFINDSLLGGKEINKGVWLGGTDQGPRKWRWVTGSPMNIDLYLWKHGNPDNGKVFVELGDLGQNCLQMSTEPGHRGQLNDYYCRKEYHFICKTIDKSIKTTQLPFISTTHSANTSTESKGRPILEIGSSNQTTVTIVSLVSVLVLVAVIIAVFIVVNRRRKARMSTNAYQDTIELSFNENIYTGLEEAGTSTNNGESNYYETPMENGSSYTMDQNIYQPIQILAPNEHEYTPLGAGPKASNAYNNTKISRKTNECASGYLEMDSVHYDKPGNIMSKPHNIVSRDFASSNRGFISDYVEPDGDNRTADSVLNDTDGRNDLCQNTYYLTPVNQGTPYYLTPTDGKLPTGK